MSDEIKKHRIGMESVSSRSSKSKRMGDEASEKEISGQKKELLPAISVAVNMIKMSQMSHEKEETEEVRSVNEEKQSDPERNFLKERLQEKLGELLQEQRALIDLYIKAEKAAREKEEEYKEKITELIEQSEKDRQLMEIFRNI